MAEMIELELPEPAWTEALGRLLAPLLADGAVLALMGPLGAGKTALTRSLLRTLGVPEEMPITSPTFGLVHRYPLAGGRCAHHLDLYRLGSLEELDDLGVEEFMGVEGVTIVEWADLFPDAFTMPTVQLRLAYRGTGRAAALVLPEGAIDEPIDAAEWRARLAQEATSG